MISPSNPTHSGAKKIRTTLRLDQLRFHEAAAPITATITSDNLLVIGDRSGIYSTSLFEVLVGQRTLLGGQVAVDDVQVATRHPIHRHIGYATRAHRPAGASIAEWFGGNLRDLPYTDRVILRNNALQTVGLEPQAVLEHSLECPRLTDTEKARVVIASGLLRRPKVLLVDPLYDEISFEGAAEVAATLKRLQLVSGLIMLLAVKGATKHALADARLLQLGPRSTD